jgi:hypothetical protein
VNSSLCHEEFPGCAGPGDYLAATGYKWWSRKKGRRMPMTKRLLVALTAATAGLLAWGAFSFMATPRAAYGDIAVVTMIFAAAYVATVETALRRWGRNS